MGYTVGSASVDIVPDFKNAQLAITKFFQSQPDAFKIPVRPEITPQATQAVEREAQVVGSKVGKAIADGAVRNLESGGVARISRQIAKLEADIEKARAREKDATSALQLAELRLQEARAKGNRSAASMLSLEQAVEKAHTRIAESQRVAAQSADLLREARRQLGIETARVAEKTTAAAQAAQEREEEAARRSEALAAQRLEREAARQAKAVEREAASQTAATEREAARQAKAIEREEALRAKAAERAMAAQRKYADQQAAEAARGREKQLREEEKSFQEQIKSQIRAMKAAQREASRDEKIRLQVEIDQRQAILDGRTYGGVVARSINHEIHQNAGLIAGVLGAALLAGAPVALAAVSGVFAAIGGAAAFQNEKLRSSWRGLWDEIKTGAVSDGAVLVPAFDRMAGAIGQSFQRMRPLLRDAFEAAGPQIDSLSSSLTRTAENALPGLVRAVQAGGPVINGLGDFLEKVGTGLTDFLDRLTTHAPAAGQAFSDLGTSFGTLLPALGEVLGQGAELGTLVLPVLNGALGGLLSVLTSLGPLLPTVAAGFLAFRLAQGAGRFVTGFSQTLLRSSQNGGLFATQMGKVGNALSKVGAALPIVGVGIAMYATLLAEADKKTAAMTQTLLKGGAEAQRLRELAEKYKGSDVLQKKFAEADKAAKDYLKTLTPLERAEHDLDVANRNLAAGMDDQSLSADELSRLKGEVARAAARQAAEEDKLARATQGVTEAMQKQADAARARVDSDFGYQKALLDVQDALLKVTDAQAALDEARADPESSPATIAAAELGLKEALLGVNEAYSDQVRLAGEVAISKLPAAMNDQQKAILGAKAELDELNTLIAQGVVLPPSLEEYRLQLLRITGEADGAMLAQAQMAAAIGELGFAVESIPGTKTIQIDAPTDELTQRLRDLGFDVLELPDGDIQVEPRTDAAFAALGDLSTLLAILNGTKAEPDAILNDEVTAPAANIFGILGTLDGTVVNPDAVLDDQVTAPTNTLFGLLDTLGGKRPNPVATATDNATPTVNNILTQMGLLQDKTVTITTIHAVKQQLSSFILGPLAPGAAIGGAVEDVLRRAPRFDGGGAVSGRGGPLDDLNLIRASHGEHMLDAHDVALMGGQAGVYAFREMLNSGAFRRPAQDNSLRRMVMSGSPSTAPAGAPPRNVRIYTQDNPRAIVRAMRADEQQQAALAPVWP